MIAAHSDWSVDERKRWMTVGRTHGGGWILDAPHPTGRVGTILQRLASAASGEPVLFGIDCPIGLPRPYGRQLEGYASFPDFLKSLPFDASFFQVARTLDEVSLYRPFFPAGNISGKGYKADLAKALGLPDAAAMWRRVDLKTADRPAAGQLFWTLGANQCGKAALAAWRDLLMPALREKQVKLWPFDGKLVDLLVAGQPVISETYPAEAMRQVGLKLNGSKQSQDARRGLASGIFAVLSKLQIRPSEALRSEIEAGFGSKKSGEDPFDSFVGALGMINVINGNRGDGSPDPADQWEGWVLGQMA
jgi:hypothetical protein